MRRSIVAPCTTQDIIRTIRHSVEWHHGSATLAYALEVHLSLEAALALLLELAVDRPQLLDLRRMSFAEKSKWAFALGLLPVELRRAVHAINQMRNGFAHGFKNTIDDDMLAAMCEVAPHLGLDIGKWLTEPDTDLYGHRVEYATQNEKTERTVFHVAEQLVLYVLTACEALDLRKTPETSADLELAE